MGTLTVVRLDRSPAVELAARSRAGLDAGRDTLLLGEARDEAVVLGTFQRPSEIATNDPIVARGSGGGAARVSPGTVWLQLALGRPDALVPCSAEKLINRYVRPLLKALTHVSSVPASYFGRDW